MYAQARRRHLLGYDNASAILERSAVVGKSTKVNEAVLIYVNKFG